MQRLNINVNEKNGERFRRVTCFCTCVDVFTYTHLNIVALYSPYISAVITFVSIHTKNKSS